MRLVPVLLGLVSVLGLLDDPVMQAQIRMQLSAFEAIFPCLAKECSKPSKKYERILNAQPGIQWWDHGGYCGSWSVQRASMAKGAWISQKQVRNHTVPGGGHDEEILATNIDVALKNLKLKFDGFDYKGLPTPQADAYRKWLKGKLVAGHGIVWMIMLHGGHFPMYPGLEYGEYTHVEPVVGILSDRPLNDTEWYDDDVIVHYTDADEHTYYRSMASLPDDTRLQGNCAKSDYAGYPCVYDKYGFGWSIEGFQDAREGVPLSLTVDPSRSEPDTRTGSGPEPLIGTLTAEGLTMGKKYTIHRWDSVDTAFDYSVSQSVYSFAAKAEKEVFTDPTPFQSDGATYYRCVADTAEIVLYS